MIPRRYTRFHPMLAFLLAAVLLPACTVGPIEIRLRGDSPAASDPSIASTVTAVFATNTAIAVLRTATANAVANAPAQATLPAALQGTSIPPGPSSELRLVYSSESLTLVNTSNRTLDISGLSFRSAGGELSIGRWDNGFLTASLYAFPPGDCLMAWDLNTEYQDKPAGCDMRHAWIAVSSQEAFWQNGTIFSVSQLGEPIAECVTAAGACSFNLP